MRAFFLPFIQETLLKAGIETDKEIQIEKPTDKKFGDFSTNIAFLLAKEAKRNPRELAGQLIGHLSFPEGTVTKTDVAGPGFINFHLDPAFIMRSAKAVLDQGETFGTISSCKGQKAIVEYVSANPTGPLTVGRGRGGVLGDCIANLLETQGYEVTREYYFNDAGRQMQILAESVRYRYLQRCGQEIEFPETHYQGDYISDIAETIFIEHGNELASHDDLALFKETAEGIIFSSIRRTLERLSITHDAFFNEHTLYLAHDGGISRNQSVIDALDQKGFIGRYENATWFMTTKLRQEKDKVLIKSSGDPSYRLPDIAYHVTKFERGFDLMVNVFGADHIDEYPDVQEALKILGYDYLQYAHARICSLMRMAEKEVGFIESAATGEGLPLLTSDPEIELASSLLDYTDVIQSCLRFLEPQKMVEYLHTVAEHYHKFYQECPILKAEPEIRTARLELSLCVRQVLRNGFRILGISAPESM